MCFVWIGTQVAASWAQQAFGASTVAAIDTEKQVIPEKDTVESRMLRRAIEFVHVGRARRMKVCMCAVRAHAWTLIRCC
jgi:hypothetical protein